MEKIKLTWLGTASVKIETPKTTLLSDPFITLNGAENITSLSDFSGADAIIVTHGHLDHLASVPQILSEYPARTYCTETAQRLLKKRLGDIKNIYPVSHGSFFTLPDMEISVYKGKHIRFDKKLVRTTLSPKNLGTNTKNIPKLLYQNLIFKENDETVFYHIKACGKNLQLMGSLALRENTDYPQNADVLFLPYQGSSDLVSHAKEVLSRLRPKQVILTHFDNAFPPISRTVDTKYFLLTAAENFPDIKVTVPEFKKAIYL